LLRAVVRIPSIIVTKQNTVLVACENRAKNEDKGEIDILIARKEQLSDFFEIRKVYSYNEMLGRSMNPSFLIDQTTGRIYLFTCHLKDNTKFASHHTTDEIDFVYKYSDDDGRTWSEEISLKYLWDLNQYTGVIPSCVSGISLHNGDLVLPTMVVKDSNWVSGLLVYSNGMWHFSKPTQKLGDNECTVYLDNSARVILNCRTYDAIRRRYIYDIENDRFVEIEPMTFDNMVIVSTQIVNDKGVFLMCFPDSERGIREQTSLYISQDGCKWSKVYNMWNGTCNGYSGIAASDNCLWLCFETNDGILLQDASSCKKVINME